MSDNIFDSPKTTEEQIQNLRNQIDANPGNITNYRKLAELLLNNQNRNRIAEAKELLNEFHKHKPDDLDSRILIIRAFRLGGQLPEAQARAEQLLNEVPENPSVLEELGRIYLAKKFYNLAEECLEKAYSINRDDDRIGRAYWEILDMLYELTNDSVYADKALTHSSILCEKKLNAHNIQLKSISLRSCNQLDSAINLLEQFEKNNPKEFDKKMWTLEDEIVSLSVNLGLYYYQMAIEKSKIKNFKPIDYEFDDNDEISLIFNEDSEHDQLLEKCLERCNKILDELEKEGDNDTVSRMTYSKISALIRLRRFEDALNFIKRELITNPDDLLLIYFEGKCHFYLKNFQKACDSFEKVFAEKPTNEFNLTLLADSYRAAGKRDAYVEKRNKLEKLKAANQSHKKTPDEIKEFSILPHQEVQNDLKVRRFFKSLKGGSLKIVDRYARADYIELLTHHVNMDEIHEIQILRGFYLERGGGQFFEDCQSLPKSIRRFNRSYEGRCKLSLKVANLNQTEHDRYAITNQGVFNIPGFDQMDESKRSDGKKIENDETVLHDKRRFEELWNSKDSILLDSKNWTALIRSLSEKVKKAGLELDKALEIQLHPDWEFSNQNKAVRDKVPEILKSKGVELQYEKLPDSEFIRKMHKKIQEESNEYLTADANSIEIEDIRKNIASLEERQKSNVDPKTSDGIAKKLGKKQSKLAEKLAENHIDPVAELADIVEAVYRMAELRGFSKAQFDQVISQRADEFGRFDENWYLIKEKEDQN